MRPRTTEHAETACPHCGYVVDNATSAMKHDPGAKAGPGCVTVCLRCGGVSAYNDDMRLEPFDAAKLDPLAARTVKRLQAAISLRRPSMNDERKPYRSPRLVEIGPVDLCGVIHCSHVAAFSFNIWNGVRGGLCATHMSELRAAVDASGAKHALKSLDEMLEIEAIERGVVQ